MIVSLDISKIGKTGDCFYKCLNESTTCNYSETLCTCEKGYFLQDCSIS
jgi:hypothetical protein